MTHKKLLLVSVIVVLISITVLSTVMAEQLRPANQIANRGVGVQIRPANQQNLPSTGNGGYIPSQGSKYSSTSVRLLSLSDASETQHYPPTQSVGRGVGVQIRPANQQNLPSTGNGGYIPSQGSKYSSNQN